MINHNSREVDLYISTQDGLITETHSGERADRPEGVGFQKKVRPYFCPYAKERIAKQKLAKKEKAAAADAEASNTEESKTDLRNAQQKAEDLKEH